jgi:hypothetical protein
MIARNAVTRCRIVVHRDLLRHDRIVFRLRLVGVGDRRDPDFEVALGLRELFHAFLAFSRRC